MISNYKEIKNYIHNEAKITKEEIQDIIRQEVKQEVQKMISSKEHLIDSAVTGYLQFAVRNAVTAGGNGYFAKDFKTRVTDSLADEMAKFIRSQIQLDLKIKE